MGNKSQEEKEFLISTRKKIGPGLTNAPVWILRKAGKRIWNKKGKRHWRDTNLGDMFKRKQREQGKIEEKKPVKKGRKNKSAILKKGSKKKLNKQ